MYKDLEGKFCSENKILGYDSIHTPIRASYQGYVLYDKDFPNHFIARTSLPEKGCLIFQESFYVKSGKQAIGRIQYLTNVAQKHNPWNRANQLLRGEKTNVF